MESPLPAPAAESPGAADPRRQALARLAASRQQLRALWLPRPASPPRGRGPRRLAALWRHWRRQLAGNAVVGLAFEAVADWWQANPWRVTGAAVAEELHQSLTPVVRRHPLASVALVTALSAAVAAARPWRWPLVAQQLRPLPGRAARWLLRQWSRGPLPALLSALSDTRMRPRTMGPASAAADSEAFQSLP